MTEFSHDPDSLADRLEQLQADGQRLTAGAGNDPLLAAAARVAEAPRPALSADASAQIEARVLAAARQMPAVGRHAPRPRRISWSLAAAAALVLLLAAILVPRPSDETAASPTPTETATASLTATVTHTPSPTVTPSPTPTLTSTPTSTLTLTPLPSTTALIEETGTSPATLPPVVPAGGGEPPQDIDCGNPPPEGAPAPGWYARCGSETPPNEVVPGHDPDHAPGNSGSAPGQNKN